MKSNRIRVAGPEDAPALLAIYGPYVERTAITYEYEVPSVEEFAGRIRKILTKYPYLVAEREGEIVGYAYAGAFHERAACAWSVETAIYVRMDQKRTGVGRALYEALEKALFLQGVINVNASIACPEEEDEYLTGDSLRFHETMGYRLVGTFRNCGCKFGRWYHLTWVSKQLHPHQESPSPIKSFDEIRDVLGW